MSKSYPWYKRDPAAFFDATRGWEGETKAYYGLLLDLIYMHDGKVADDSGYIVGQLGLSSKRKWTSLKNELISRGKITVSNGYIENFRATLETKKRRKIGDKSEIIEPVSNENSGLTLLDIERDREEERNIINRSVSQSKKVTTDDQGFDEFWKVFPHSQPSSRPKALGAWRKLSGDDRAAALDAASVLDRPPRDMFAWTWLAERHFAFTGPKPVPPIPMKTPEEKAARIAELEAAERERKTA